VELVYFVQNKRTRQVLNRQGTWSRDFGSYRLATFATEAEATAAFPAGVECVVVEKKKKPSEETP
jgi:hypothetical protein